MHTNKFYHYHFHYPTFLVYYVLIVLNCRSRSAFGTKNPDITKTAIDNIVAISDYIFYVYFFQGEAEGVVIELAHIDVSHPQQGRLKFLL